MKWLKQYFINNKSRIIFLFIIVVIFIGLLVFVKNDYFLYKETIIKAIEVKETKTNNESEETVEPSYIQHVKAKIMNGKDRGKIIEFENESSYSGLHDYHISKGDDLIVDQLNNLSVRFINGIKRDYYVALQVVIFCFVLILVASKKSLLILGSMMINILLFILIIYLRNKGLNLLLLFSIGTIFFTVITLLMIGGYNKKTLGAIISTLLSVLIMMIIATIVLNLHRNEIHFETIEFLEYFYDYDLVFFSGLLISGLGAIMDLAVLMATSINELIDCNPAIKISAIKESAWQIAQDITGTMLNVLFFSSIAGTMPIIIFLARNGQSITYSFSYFGSAEIIRALVGAIGIILTIPISYVVNLTLRKKWKA